MSDEGGIEFVSVLHLDLVDGLVLVLTRVDHQSFLLVNPFIFC